MPLLRKGKLLVSETTTCRYRITSDRVARGGFGEVYRGSEVDAYQEEIRPVAIKVGLNPIAWHGEAYFGRLLSGQSRVVALHDAFPLFDGTGRARQSKYILVFDWMDQGTVSDALARGLTWSEGTVVREIRGILAVLSLLHRRGICHGDITPNNIFVSGTRLLLGDLGIAKQALDDKPVDMDGAAPAVFTPPDAKVFRWTPAGDVYQVGLIALSLLSGEVVTSPDVCGRLLRSLRASDAVKRWMHTALKSGKGRYQNAAEARDCLGGPVQRGRRAPISLRDQVVVFTGFLPMTRSEATKSARRAGAEVQCRVTGRTTLVVAGDPNPQMIGKAEGRKRFEAGARIHRGQRIAIITAAKFQKMLS